MIIMRLGPILAEPFSNISCLYVRAFVSWTLILCTYIDVGRDTRDGFNCWARDGWFNMVVMGYYPRELASNIKEHFLNFLQRNV